MNINLLGKTALVTGSTAGIGLAIAKGLASSAATIVINGRTQEKVAEAIEQIKTQNPQAVVSGIATDLSSAEGCAQLVAQCPQCDILVNNLGIYGEQDFFETTDDLWEQFFQVNVMSGVRLARAYLPTMMQKSWGRVVFISSESALNIPAEMVHYGASKTALLGIARGLAKRVAGTGVTVNSVLPGPTASEGFIAARQKEIEGSEQTLEAAEKAYVMRMRPSSIIQRPASVEEVANMVVYVCSKQASATTGAALRVDGGVVDTIA